MPPVIRPGTIVLTVIPSSAWPRARPSWKLSTARFARPIGGGSPERASRVAGVEDGNDAAEFPRQHRLGRRGHAKECASRIDVEHFIPSFRRDFQKPVEEVDRGAIHHDVESAKSLHDGLHAGADLVGAGNVNRQREAVGLAARQSQRLIGRFHREVRDGQRRSLVCIGDRDGAAEASAASHDECRAMI